MKYTKKDRLRDRNAKLKGKLRVAKRAVKRAEAERDEAQVALNNAYANAIAFLSTAREIRGWEETALWRVGLRLQEMDLWIDWPDSNPQEIAEWLRAALRGD